MGGMKRILEDPRLLKSWEAQQRRRNEEEAERQVHADRMAHIEAIQGLLKEGVRPPLSAIQERDAELRAEYRKKQERAERRRERRRLREAHAKAQ